jgi:serine/threonine protein phosphatase PrpC
MPVKDKWKSWFGERQSGPLEDSEQSEDLEGGESSPDTGGELPEARSSGALPALRGGGPPVLSSTGELSTFASKPWWKSDWWLLDPGGQSGDVSCDVGTAGDLAVAAASIRGNSHRLDGTRCEDSFALSTGKTDDDAPFLVVAVGDGVGSADYSSYGSKRATYLLATKLASRLTARGQLDFEIFATETEQLLKEIKVAIRGWRTDDYLAPPLPATDVSTASLETTLTFAVVPATAKDGGIRDVFIGFVGDSPLFKLSDGTWRRIPEVVDEDLLDPTTAGLHSGKVAVTKCRLGDDEVLVLVTDGIGNFVTRGDQMLAVGDHLAKVLRTPVTADAFIAELMFDFVSADDDRTAVVCWPNRQQHSA